MDAIKTEMGKDVVKALSELKNPERSGTAEVPTKSGGKYSYTYAQLPEILSAAREVFAKHNLAIMQDVESDNGNIKVRTIFCHVSGETLSFSWLALPSGGTPQTAGSAITYARRYSLCAALGVAGEEDDDGTAAQNAPKPAQKPAETKERTPGGASVKSVNLARSLFCDLGLAQHGHKGETKDEIHRRRSDGNANIRAWLDGHGFFVGDDEDPLAALPQNNISAIIDTLKEQMEQPRDDQPPIEEY